MACPSLLPHGPDVCRALRLTETASVFRRDGKCSYHLRPEEVSVKVIELAQPVLIASLVRDSPHVQLDMLHVHEAVPNFLLDEGCSIDWSSSAHHPR